MRRITGTRRNHTAAATAGAVLALLLVTCLGLAACGGSSSSTTNATNANAAAKTTGGRATGPTGFRYERKVRRFVACMRANGVKLPEPNFSGGGPVLRIKGLEAASEPFRAGLAKCRGTLR